MFSTLRSGRAFRHILSPGFPVLRFEHTIETVRDLAAIGYHGQPLRSPFRPVRPPVPVLVDLAVLFPRQPHRSGRYHPHGLQMHRVVPGSLSCWGLCEQGEWWGLVTYGIQYGAQRRTVTHWVPAWTLTPGIA